MTAASGSGFTPLPVDAGLELFDLLALGDDPRPVATRLDLPALRASGDVPHVLRGLVRTRRRTAGAAEAGGLRQRLAGLPAAEQIRLLTDLVRTEAARCSATPAPTPSRPDRAFRDLGFDSLTAVELRNRLGAATGLRLPATLVFDHPTAAGRSPRSCTPTARRGRQPGDPGAHRGRAPATTRSRSSAWPAATRAA